MVVGGKIRRVAKFFDHLSEIYLINGQTWYIVVSEHVIMVHYHRLALKEQKISCQRMIIAGYRYLGPRTRQPPWQGVIMADYQWLYSLILKMSIDTNKKQH